MDPLHERLARAELTSFGHPMRVDSEAGGDFRDARAGEINGQLP